MYACIYIYIYIYIYSHIYIIVYTRIYVYSHNTFNVPEVTQVRFAAFIYIRNRIHMKHDGFLCEPTIACRHTLYPCLCCVCWYMGVCSVHLCVREYVCVCVCLHVCVGVYVHVCVCMFVCMCVYRHTSISISSSIVFACSEGHQLCTCACHRARPTAT